MNEYQRDFQTFVGHPWWPFNQGNQDGAAAYRPGQWEFEPWQGETSGSGQTLRDVLEELQAPRVPEEAQWHDAQTTARLGIYRARTSARASEGLSRGSGYESGMRRSHRTRGLEVPNYVHKRKIARGVKPRPRNTEATNAAMDEAESLAEAPEKVQVEEGPQAADQAPQEGNERSPAMEQAPQEGGERSRAEAGEPQEAVARSEEVEQAAQDVREGALGATGERTDATSVDSMDLPAGSAPVATVQAEGQGVQRSLTSMGDPAGTGNGMVRIVTEVPGTSRQEPRDERATRRSQRILDRELRATQPERYRQRTEITGADTMIMLEGTGQRRQRTKITGHDPLNVGRNRSRRDAVERSAESEFYDALGGAERAEALDSTTAMEPARRRLADVFRRAQHRIGEDMSATRASPSSRIRVRGDGQQSESETEGRPWKRARTGSTEGSTNRQREVEVTMRALEEEFEEKVRQSQGGVWCEPVPHERKVATVCEFYQAFNDVKTLAIHTCTLCYRKFATTELEEFDGDQSTLEDFSVRVGAQFKCVECFASGRSVFGCAECVRSLERGVLSPAAHLHGRLRCEHAYPDALKDLTPVEEKLIALNSCYGFITKYNVVKGSRESATYPKHVKGHITVFPSSVQELVTRVLPHPLLKVMDEIHVSWQGAEKPAPKDLSLLLSVRRRVVERALVWLKRNNPHYAGIEINSAEMESWGQSSHGVPDQIYERLERNEPSAWEKTRTAQLVPQTERGLEPGDDVDVREILAALNEPEVASVGLDDATDENREGIQEISASGMFALDGLPDVQNVEKLQCLYDALGPKTGSAETVHGGDRGEGSTALRGGGMSEPYIVVSRGEEFADSNDAWFFAKTFPTLFPFGAGGPRQVEESLSGVTAEAHEVMPPSQEPIAREAVTSRNLSLEVWARIVLQRHGGRFAMHKVFAFLVFNMLVRFRNHRVSMMSVTRKDFPEVERVVRTLSSERLEKAGEELQASGKTSDTAVNRLLRSLSLYGLRQPMSRELRLGMRRKIKSLIVKDGIPAIWFTLNPNDITNPVKLRLAAYRTRDPDEAEVFLTELDSSYKRMRLAISDPLSSALFFHREISMFFRHYVKVGEDGVFGRISQYFGAVETNERGALHLHGLLWLHGNMRLGSLWKDVEDGASRMYQDKVVRYVDSIFTEVCPRPGSLSIEAVI
jgi:hypothetical protein